MVRKPLMLVCAILAFMLVGMVNANAQNQTFSLDSFLVSQMPVPQHLNTKYGESSPLMNAAETKLIFNRLADSKNYILESKKIDGFWGEPVDISDAFSADNDMQVVDISADGQTLILASLDKRSDIYYSKIEEGTWSEPESFKVFNGKSKEGFAAISFDERLFVFTSDREGGFGGMDIYFSVRKEDGTWSEPKNMGKNINSPANETTPSIHTDGTTLFFGSDRKGGFGGFDIYVSTMGRDSVWSKAATLGKKVNTEKDDLCFKMSVKKNKAFWVSGDVPNALDIQFAEISAPKAIPSQVVYSGSLTLADDGPPGIVNITISDAETKEVVGEYRPNSLTGEYTYILEPNKKFNVLLTAPGYLGYTHDFVAPLDSAYSIIKRVIQLDKIRFYNPPMKIVDGEKFTEVNDILFKLDEFKVIEYDKNLNLLADHLIANKGCVIEIGGHADAKGNKYYNKRLSRKRAVQVADYLKKRGVPKTSFVIRDYGQSRPIAQSVSEEMQRFNRRVEFKVMKQGDVKLVVKEVEVPESYKIPRKWKPNHKPRKKRK